jgi:hypothetical protein
MTNLLLRLASLFSWPQRSSLDEQYRAQAVDAPDFEVRPRAFERARPWGSRRQRHADGYIGRKRWPKARLTLTGC